MNELPSLSLEALLRCVRAIAETYPNGAMRKDISRLLQHHVTDDTINALPEVLLRIRILSLRGDKFSVNHFNPPVTALLDTGHSMADACIQEAFSFLLLRDEYCFHSFYRLFLTSGEYATPDRLRIRGSPVRCEIALQDSVEVFNMSGHGTSFVVPAPDFLTGSIGVLREWSKADLHLLDEVVLSPSEIMVFPVSKTASLSNQQVCTELLKKCREVRGVEVQIPSRDLVADLCCQYRVTPEKAVAAIMALGDTTLGLLRFAAKPRSGQDIGTRWSTALASKGLLTNGGKRYDVVTVNRLEVAKVCTHVEKGKEL